MTTRIDELPSTILPSVDHEIPSMKDGLTVKLSVSQILSLVIGSAGSALDTLGELAAALDNDPNFAATIASQITTLTDEDLTFLKHDGSRNMSGDLSFAGFNLLDVGNYIGLCLPFAMSTAPTGWLKANGAAVNRTTYARLFAAIGTTYGEGDGSTTFNLPDLRGEFVRGWDDGRGVDTGRSIGSTQGDAIRNILGNITAAEGLNEFVIGEESTVYGGAFYKNATGGFNAQTTTEDNITARDVRFDASRVVPTAPENRPRNVALLYCVKY